MYNAELGYKEPVIEGYWTYNTMIECFTARETLLLDMEIYDGIPPVNTQLVCIRTEEE
jgi:hypothetical protein